MTARAELFAPGVERVEVEVVAGAAPAASAEEERVWLRMRQENPRLFGGGIYSVLDVDAADGGRVRIVAARDLYKRLVVQAEVAAGGGGAGREVWQLSVSALAVAADVRGRPMVLLGKRGVETRIYGGMWQICPAGGVDAKDPEAAMPRRIGHNELVEQLRREFAEEVGFELGERAARPLAVVRDERARSVDVVLRVDFELALPPRPKRGSAWEHEAIRWVAVEELGAFAARERVVESTRAVLGAVGLLPVERRG